MSGKSFWQEARDQVLHFIMGYVPSFAIIFGISKIGYNSEALYIPWWWGYPVGIIVTRIIWMLREMKQKNWQYIVWSNLDLGFIDLGIAASVITLLLSRNTV